MLPLSPEMTIDDFAFQKSSYECLFWAVPCCHCFASWRNLQASRLIHEANCQASCPCCSTESAACQQSSQTNFLPEDSTKFNELNKESTSFVFLRPKVLKVVKVLTHDTENTWISDHKLSTWLRATWAANDRPTGHAWPVPLQLWQCAAHWETWTSQKLEETLWQFDAKMNGGQKKRKERNLQNPPHILSPGDVKILVQLSRYPTPIRRPAAWASRGTAEWHSWLAPISSWSGTGLLSTYLRVAWIVPTYYQPKHDKPMPTNEAKENLNFSAKLRIEPRTF